jgi:hypothetical protein
MGMLSRPGKPANVGQRSNLVLLKQLDKPFEGMIRVANCEQTQSLIDHSSILVNVAKFAKRSRRSKRCARALREITRIWQMQCARLAQFGG